MQWRIPTLKNIPFDIRKHHNVYLDQACLSGDLGVVQLLVDTFGLAKADVYDSGGLGSACGNGHLDIVKWLVDSFEIGSDDIYRADIHHYWRSVAHRCIKHASKAISMLCATLSKSSASRPRNTDRS